MATGEGKRSWYSHRAQPAPPRASNREITSDRIDSDSEVVIDERGYRRHPRPPVKSVWGVAEVVREARWTDPRSISSSLVPGLITDLEETYRACRERLWSSHSTRERAEGRTWLKLIDQRLDNLSTVAKRINERIADCEAQKVMWQERQFEPAEVDIQARVIEFRKFYWGLFTDVIRHRKSVSGESRNIERELEDAFEDICGSNGPMEGFLSAMVHSLSRSGRLI